MTGDEEWTIVLADASVVVNLAIVDRVELLAALRDHRFLVPLEVIGEVERHATSSMRPSAPATCRRSP